MSTNTNSKTKSATKTLAERERVRGRPKQAMSKCNSSPNPQIDASTSPSNAEPDNARFTAFDEDLVQAFREIAPNNPILLLTPVVPHPDDSATDRDNADPFEVFGRALSKHHKKIRHVPYLPGKNITDAHMTFLQRSSGVIVVCCEPNANLTDPAQVMDRNPSLDVQLFCGQLRFASQVQQVLQAWQEQNSESETVFVAVGFGPPRCLLDQGIGLQRFGTVAYAPYQSRAMEDVADLLYGVN